MCQPSWHINDIFFAGFPICTSAPAQAKNSATFPSPSRHLLFLSHCPLFIRHCHPFPVIASEQRERGNPQQPTRTLSPQRTTVAGAAGTVAGGAATAAGTGAATAAIHSNLPALFRPKGQPLQVPLALARPLQMPLALALALPPTRTCGHRHTLPRTAAPDLSISNIRLTI